MLVKSAVHPSAPLIFMEIMISEMDSVPAMQWVIIVSKERNEVDNKGSEVLGYVNWPGTSFILFQIGFGLLEITFSSGGRRKVNSLQTDDRDCVPRSVCVAY